MTGTLYLYSAARIVRKCLVLATLCCQTMIQYCRWELWQWQEQLLASTVQMKIRCWSVSLAMWILQQEWMIKSRLGFIWDEASIKPTLLCKFQLPRVSILISSLLANRCIGRWYYGIIEVLGLLYEIQMDWMGRNKKMDMKYNFQNWRDLEPAPKFPPPLLPWHFLLATVICGSVVE